MDSYPRSQSVDPIPGSPGSPATDGYDEVVSAIRSQAGTTIAVPQLSTLLGVKATTLNARFRRERIPVSIIGRTNYIPCQLALALAERHKYALYGWPTLHEASRATGVKSATIKARCEKGKLEGHPDLTKRLRLNPLAVESLQVRARANWSPRGLRPADSTPIPSVDPPAPRLSTTSRNVPPAVPEFPRRFVPAPAPVPAPVSSARRLPAREYGFGGIAALAPPAATPSVSARSLFYDPDRPPCVADCAVGSPITYGDYEGRILKVLDDPFSPRIQVRFPSHVMEVMREVMLTVRRRPPVESLPRG